MLEMSYQAKFFSECECFTRAPADTEMSLFQAVLYGEDERMIEIDSFAPTSVDTYVKHMKNRRGNAAKRVCKKIAELM